MFFPASTRRAPATARSGPRAAAATTTAAAAATAEVAPGRTRHRACPGRRGPCARWPLAAALAAGLLGAGCRLIEADAHNLDQLHGADGRHRYSGALEGDFEYVFRHKIGALFPKSNLAAGKAPKKIKNPAGECMKKMLRLASYESASQTVASQQVEWFSRLAVDDPATLSRERALIELGKASERLGVEPLGLAPEALAAGPAALSEALASLARAVRQTAAGTGSPELRAADLEAAAEVVEGLDLDLDGARRALLVSGELLAQKGLYSSATPTLERLNLHLQRVCVERSLNRALQDENAFVRAAAIETVVRAHGPEALAPLLPRLAVEPVEVASRTLKLVTEFGLPQGPPPDLPADAAAPDYLAAIYRVLELYRDEGHLRVQAMRALSAASGAGIQSLREEDWQVWWLARNESRRAGATDRKEQGPGGGSSGSASAP